MKSSGSLLIVLAALGPGALLSGCSGGTSEFGSPPESGSSPDSESAPSALAMPPEGYELKWSKCAHYIEGDARLLNNSRVVPIASDGTIPLQRAEPLGNADDDFRRVVAAKVPNKLIGGEGHFARDSRQDVNASEGPRLTVASASGAATSEPEEKVSFVKLGQMVLSREPDDSIVQWVVSSEPLGDPVPNDSGELEYQATCFRNPNLTGHDTAGYIAPGGELHERCLVEEMNLTFNALSIYGYLPLVNHVTLAVPSLNNPKTHPTPDFYAHYLGEHHGLFWYTGAGAALNDINGGERDQFGTYYGLDIYCHMIVSGGLEVPGAKRPATKSLPAPGIVNGNSYIAWRPVNLNVQIANHLEPEAASQVEPGSEPEPEVEPEPELALEPVDADAIGPL